MAKKTPKNLTIKKLIKDLEKALGNRKYLMEDITFEGDYLEVPLEYTDLLVWDTVEEILKKYNYYISYVGRKTIVYRKGKRGVMIWY